MRWLWWCLAPIAVACARGATAPGVSRGVARGDVRARIDTVLYDVRGSTPLEWRAFMREHGPGVESPRYAAATEWRISPRYQLRKAGAQCRPGGVHVNLFITVRLPRLADTGGVHPADRAEWDRFTRHLGRHEDGHVLRARRAAGAVVDSVRRVTGWTCGDAQRAIGDAVRAVIAEHRERQRAYDLRTRRGGRQGANLPSADGMRFDVDTTLIDTLPRAMR